jgi:hypothetical protein
MNSQTASNTVPFAAELSIFRYLKTRFGIDGQFVVRDDPEDKRQCANRHPKKGAAQCGTSATATVSSASFRDSRPARGLLGSVAEVYSLKSHDWVERPELTSEIVHTGDWTHAPKMRPTLRSKLGRCV